MSGFAIDASLALAWCFEDEASADSDALFDRIRDEGAVVPALWHLELANVLLQVERRGRITAADAAARLDVIAELPIDTDHETPARAWGEILALARAHGLTTYDACYLDLARRQGLTLLTRDEALAAAAGRCGVTVLPRPARPTPRTPRRR